MKTLYESILDDEDEIMDRMGSDMLDVAAGDINGQFCTDFLSGNRFTEEDHPIYIKDNNTIFVPLVIKRRDDNGLILNNFKNISCEQLGFSKDITIESTRISVNIGGPINREFSPDLFCGGLRAHCISLFNITNINNVKFELNKIIQLRNKGITKSMLAPKFSINSYSKVKLENVDITIKGIPLAYLQIIMHTPYFPEFNNVTTTADTLKITDTFLFDKGYMGSELENILDLNTKVHIKDTKLGEEVYRPLNSMGKIIATLRNKKRYVLTDPGREQNLLFPINPDSRLDDVFKGINDCKTIRRIYLGNNNVYIILTKQKIANAPRTKDGWALMQITDR